MTPARAGVMPLAEVQQDRPEPGPKREARIEAATTRIDRQEALLDDVFCEGPVTELAACHAEQGELITPDELLKGRRLAGLHPLHQELVREFHSYKLNGGEYRWEPVLPTKNAPRATGLRQG